MLQLHLRDQQFYCLLRCTYIRGLTVVYSIIFGHFLCFVVLCLCFVVVCYPSIQHSAIITWSIPSKILTKDTQTRGGGGVSFEGQTLYHYSAWVIVVMYAISCFIPSSVLTLTSDCLTTIKYGHFLTFDIISMRYKGKRTLLMTSQWRSGPPSTFPCRCDVMA